MLPSDTVDILPLSGCKEQELAVNRRSNSHAEGKGFVKPLPTQSKTLSYSTGVK